jgi:predicted phage-related endonuclease
VTRAIGSGDIAAIVGVDPHKGRMAAWARICGYVDSRESEVMTIGLAMEEPIVKLAAKKYNWLGYRRASTHYHPRVPHLRATPDWWIECQEAWSETKWISPWMQDRWHDHEGACVPSNYVVQVQFQMEVTGVERVYVTTILGGSVLALPVRRDREFGEALVEIANRFWRDYVLTDTPPNMPDGSDVWSAFLVSRWPRVMRPELLPASPEDEALLLELREAAAAKKAAEVRYKTAAQLLEERIKDAQGIQGACGKALWIERAGYETKPAKVEPTRYVKGFWKKDKPGADAP